MLSKCTFVVTLGTALFLSHCVAVTEEKKRPFGPAAYDGRIIDAHNHPRRQSWDKLTRHFADATISGIERVIVMRTPNDYRNSKRDALLARAQNFANVTTLCSGDFVGYLHKGWLDRAKHEVSRIKSDLKSGNCAGVGEVGLRHYDKMWARGGGQHEVIVPLDTRLVLDLLAVANQLAVPVILHIEPVYRPRDINNLGEIKLWYKKVCKKFPAARLVAAHTGMMSPPDIEELLLACPNLYADFKVLHGYGVVIGFADLYAVNDLDFRFFEHWAAMFEKYPDRFIYGSDWKEGRRRGYRDRSYRKHIERVRKMIGSLATSVQEKIAYSNAKKIFRLP